MAQDGCFDIMRHWYVVVGVFVWDLFTLNDLALLYVNNCTFCQVYLFKGFPKKLIKKLFWPSYESRVVALEFIVKVYRKNQLLRRIEI